MTLHTERIRTLDDIRAFLDGNQAADIAPHDREAAYAFIDRTLVRFRYHFGLSRVGKGLVRRFLAKVTGYSAAWLPAPTRRWFPGPSPCGRGGDGPTGQRCPGSMSSGGRSGATHCRKGGRREATIPHQRMVAQRADLKMPGALEAIDEVLADVNGGGHIPGDAIEGCWAHTAGRASRPPESPARPSRPQPPGQSRLASRSSTTTTARILPDSTIWPNTPATRSPPLLVPPAQRLEDEDAVGRDTLTGVVAPAAPQRSVTPPFPPATELGATSSELAGRQEVASPIRPGLCLRARRTPDHAPPHRCLPDSPETRSRHTSPHRAQGPPATPPRTRSRPPRIPVPAASSSGLVVAAAPVHAGSSSSTDSLTT